MTAIGIYQSDFIVMGTFPFVSPKFVILTMYYEIRDSISSDVLIRVQSPTAESAETAIAEFKLERKNVPPTSTPPSEEEKDQEQIWHVRVPFLFAPIVLPGEGRLKVRAHYGDGTVLRLGSLRVRGATPEEIKLFTGVPSPPLAGG